jgi:hypothetical protein
LRSITELSRLILLYGTHRPSRLPRWREDPLLDHHRRSGEVMPALLAWVPQFHDQHDQQPDAGDTQSPEHQCPHTNPTPADRPTVKKSNQLQFHGPQTRARRSHGKQVPHQNDPADYDG